MAERSTIIEGTVKFRDGKKWKSRWCVMRKLSPVADCVQLVLYRDARALCAGAASKAALSLQSYVGCEAGFTLDKQSHTLALLCAEVTAVLAFESHARLLQWQAKLATHLGPARGYLVQLRGANAGPARLHVQHRSCALSAGLPPRLLGLWDIAHLRRYGVLDGRFCFEGGSHCGKGQGLHVLLSDQAAEILRDFELASRGQLTPRRSTTRGRSGESPKCEPAWRTKDRLELSMIERSLPPTELCLYEQPSGADPCWPAAQRTPFTDMGLADSSSVHAMAGGGVGGPWDTGQVMLERCMSCMSKLGALSRSSTAALTPGAQHFSPAWTMEEVGEARPLGAPSEAEPANKRCSAEVNAASICRCRGEPTPERPPKPTNLDLKLTRKPPMPLPARSFSHAHLSSIKENSSVNIGPYDNYDIPKLHTAEVEGEYYDTPKRLKECLNKELFKMTRSSTTNTLVLKKSCGCLLKLDKEAKPVTVVDSDESFPQASCPCQKVTAWANSWIKLPYCSKQPDDANDKDALYATVDLSRKTRRKSLQHEYCMLNNTLKPKGLEKAEVDDGPLAYYENLSFALSLEHYENAKELLKRAGVTQKELDALSANLGRNLHTEASDRSVEDDILCAKCGYPQDDAERCRRGPPHDEYLLMAPNAVDNDRPLPAGYTPMSPIGGFSFHTLKYPAKNPVARLLDEKSASNPTLCGSEKARADAEGDAPAQERTAARPTCRERCSSADSSRFLADGNELEGRRGSASSIETLRDTRAEAAPCECAAKHSDADSSEASKAKGAAVPAGGNRDSSSSNDSGVSSWSLRGDAGAAGDFELPATTAAARRRYRSARRAHTAPLPPPRRSRSSSGLRASPPSSHKCQSAEAEVPVLCNRPFTGVVVADSRSTSSGTSDMSDYIETLSIYSSHSSCDTPATLRVLRQVTSTLRPRSGKEYRPLTAGLCAADQPYRQLP